MFGVDFISEKTGFAVGASGVILRCDDGGTYWEIIESGTRNWLEDIEFVDEKTGIIVGDRGTILKTIDGGVTWKKIKTNLKQNLYALDFADELNGFTIGANGVILRTTDGGETWQDVESPLEINLYGVRARGKDSAIVVGELGAVWVTNDGGKNWEIQPNITTNSLQTVVFLGGRDLWIAGRGGTILKRSQTLATVKTAATVLPPILKIGGSSKPKAKSREPLITITDDGDIPLATPPVEDNQ